MRTLSMGARAFIPVALAGAVVLGLAPSSPAAAAEPRPEAQQIVAIPSTKAASSQRQIMGRVNLRRGAGIDRARITVLRNDTRLVVLAKGKDSHGRTWLKVDADSRTGWVASWLTESISGSSSDSTGAPRTYSGGNFVWPTTSQRISQPFHYGHYGLDIDGDTGDPIFAAAGGTVTFAGWKSNGGGYQVWIAHGTGSYTTYNHMASVSVGRGQRVDRGQRVGLMGASGLATGSHLHFEVWRGPIWNGGQRVNPLGYL